MTTTSPRRPPADAADELRARIRGDVFVPGDAGHERWRRGWNLSFEHHPDVLVVPADERDVITAVTVADDYDLPVGVQATGHGVTRRSDGGLLIVTSRMTDVAVDPQREIARVAAGAKWMHVLAAATPHGLTPLLGSTSDAGAVGYTLGGGYGWLGRRYGLSADHVEEFEVATAAGTLVRASRAEHADLFWALRGGGAGTFGIVTAMTIRLVPLTHVYGGNLLYPPHLAEQAIRRWRDWTAAAPAELTSSFVLMNFPPLPGIPEPVRGRSFAIVRGCWSGAPADGEELLRYWRDWRTPELDTWTVLPVSEMDRISEDPVDPLPAVVTTEWLRSVPDALAAALPRHVLATEGPTPLLFAEVRHVGGAVSALEPHDAGAFGNRDGTLLFEAVGVVPAPGADGVVRAALEELRTLLAPHATGGAYLNFLEGEDRVRRARDGFSKPAWERLRQVKARYDPHDRFRRGLPVPPARRQP